MVTIVTDSSACLPLDLPDAVPGRLRILPIVIDLADGELVPDTPTAAPVVFRAVAEGRRPRTRAPAVADYVAALDESDADGAVVVTPPSEFTSMPNNAAVAAALSRRPVRVVDCRTAAAAQGLVAAAGAAVAAAGGSLDEVEATIRNVCDRARLVATMDPAHRSPGFAGPAVVPDDSGPRVHPIFRLRDGLVERLGACRDDGWTEALRREAEREGWNPGARSVVFQAGATPRAERLRRSLAIGEPPVELSPAMCVHTGPGVVGVAWLDDAA
ncbi:MAG TPA: DegV family protein [Actinomycetota bacterium]